MQTGDILDLIHPDTTVYIENERGEEICAGKPCKIPYWRSKHTLIMAGSFSIHIRIKEEP